MAAGGPARAYDFVVTQDSSGRLRTVQAVFGAVPDFWKKMITIFVNKSIYKEKLGLAGCKPLVTLINEGRDCIVLTYDGYH